MPELPPPLPASTEAPLIVRGSRIGTVLACMAILLTVVLVLWFTPRWKKEMKAVETGPNVLLEMLGRYVAGSQVLFIQGEAWNEASDRDAVRAEALGRRYKFFIAD